MTAAHVLTLTCVCAGRCWLLHRGPLRTLYRPRASNQSGPSPFPLEVCHNVSRPLPHPLSHSSSVSHTQPSQSASCPCGVPGPSRQPRAGTGSLLGGPTAPPTARPSSTHTSQGTTHDSCCLLLALSPHHLHSNMIQHIIGHDNALILCTHAHGHQCRNRYTISDGKACTHTHTMSVLCIHWQPGGLPLLILRS